VVLVDTSVWLRALAGRQPFARALDALLDGEEVLGHEMVYGELLVGDRGARAALLADYELITHAPTVPHGEVVAFVCARGLQGRGIGWIDAHLLASALVASAALWTTDTRLSGLPVDLGISYCATTTCPPSAPRCAASPKGSATKWRFDSGPQWPAPLDPGAQRAAARRRRPRRPLVRDRQSTSRRNITALVDISGSYRTFRASPRRCALRSFSLAPLSTRGLAT